MQVYTCTIWGGLYGDSPETSTPKRRVLYSNDEDLLKRLEQAAGHATPETLWWTNMKGQMGHLVSRAMQL